MGVQRDTRSEKLGTAVHVLMCERNPYFVLFFLAPKENKQTTLVIHERRHLMSNYDFLQPVSVDFAPHGSVCEWCGKPAEQQLTAIGGTYHNEGGFFCRLCGEEFIRAVVHSLKAEAAAEVNSKGVDSK
jgi:hypothetical protein